MKISTITGWEISQLFRYKASLIFILGMILTSVLPLKVNSQTPGTVEDAFNLPDRERCTSKDLEVVSATLDLNNCDCVEGTTSYYDLILGINNKTGSTRTSYAFWARLTSTDPGTGDETVYFVNGCQGPIARKSTTFQEFNNLKIFTYNEATGDFEEVYDPREPGELLHQIPYTCGETLELSNIYEGWTDAADNTPRQCPLDPSEINPKCGVTESLRVDVGLSAASLTTNVSCYGADDGSITLSFVGGKAPYFLSFDGSGYSQQTSPKSFINLEPGTYEWSVKDSNVPPCIKTGSEIISEPDQVILQTSSTNISCNGLNDGSLSIDNYSGTGDPTFYLKTGNGSFIEKTLAQIEAITAAGDYVIKVTYPDGNDLGVCEQTSSESITEPALVTLETSSTNISCNGSGDGSLSIDSFSGTGEPTFYLKTGDGAFVEKTEAQIEAITAAGDYVIKVTYPNGNADGVCEQTSSESITEPDEVTLETSSSNISCNGLNDGSLKIDSYSGTGVPTFYLKTGDGTFVEMTKAEIEAITAAGDYVIKVTYANGKTNGICEKTSSESITEPAKVLPPDYETRQADCKGGNGSVAFRDLDPDTTLYYDLLGDLAGYIEYTGAISIPLGESSFKIKYDDSDCESEAFKVNITKPDDVEVTLASALTQPNCITGTGTIEILNAVILGELNYTVYNQANPGVPLAGYNYVKYPDGGFSGLEPGTYFISAVSDDGCESGNIVEVLLEPQCITCETAFARDAGSAVCFADVPNVSQLISNESRWGWTNYYASAGNYTLDLYAGAGQCDISKGALVGDVQVIDNGDGTIDVKFSADEGYILSSVHLYVGCTPFPYKKQGRNYSYTVAPGQYPHNPKGDIGYVTEYTIEGVSVTGGFYLIAHADVCSSTANPELIEQLRIESVAGSTTLSRNASTMLACLSSSKTLTKNMVDAGKTGNLTESSLSVNANDSKFNAYPVPFKSQVSLRYEFDYTSDVKIQFFDLNGSLLRTYTDKQVTRGDDTQMNIDFALRAKQVYIIRVETDREVFTRKVMSGN